MSYLTTEMMRAIAKGNPNPIHTIQLDGKKFIFECDVEQMKLGIESLRPELLAKGNRYGYQEYQGDPDVELTNEKYQANLDKFQLEFEKRLQYDYVKNIIINAKKKKNGTFNKNRVYDEYVLENAADNGSGAVNIYKVKYEVSNDLTMRLIFHYATEHIEYNM